MRHVPHGEWLARRSESESGERSTRRRLRRRRGVPINPPMTDKSWRRWKFESLIFPPL